jgi:DNA-binding beta-propeller fold protein YncE
MFSIFILVILRMLLIARTLKSGIPRISHREIKLHKLKMTALVAVLLASAIFAWGQTNEPLVLLQTIPLPALHDGDFDHFAVDLPSHRLFLTAEKNAAVEVFDLRTNKLVRTLTEIEEPHSMLYRSDLKKLFVIDGGAAEVKIYEGDTYKRLGAIKLEDDADSMAYDPATKYLYVVNGGKGAKMAYCLISILDTTTDKKLADVKIDSDSVEALALEKSGPRLFVNITGKDAVGVIDREKRAVIATWPIGQEGKHNVAMAFDEAAHRLFISTNNPEKMIVLNSDSGAIVTSLSTGHMVDDMAYDAKSKRIYVTGSDFIDVFQQKDADHYELVGQVPSSFRAKTAILLPQMNRYYLAVPRHEGKPAEVRVFEVKP